MSAPLIAVISFQNFMYDVNLTSEWIMFSICKDLKVKEAS
jgi:hypothetical protein